MDGVCVFSEYFRPYTRVHQYRLINWLHYTPHKYKNDITGARHLPTFKIPKAYLSLLFRVVRNFRNNSSLGSFEAKVFTNHWTSCFASKVKLGRLSSNFYTKPVDIVFLFRVFWCACRVAFCSFSEFLGKSLFVFFEWVLIARRPSLSNIYGLLALTYMMTSVIFTVLAGLSVPGLTGNFSRPSRTSSPPTSFPKTVCFLSRWGASLNVRKNWDLAILIISIALECNVCNYHSPVSVGSFVGHGKNTTAVMFSRAF